MTKKNKKTKAVKNAKASPITDSTSSESTALVQGAELSERSGGGSTTEQQANTSTTEGQDTTDEAAPTAAALPTDSADSKGASPEPSATAPPMSSASISEPTTSKSDPSGNASKAMTATQSTTNKQSKLVWIGLLVVALFAAVASGYLWQQAKSQQVMLQADINAALQRVDQQNQNTRQLQREIDRVVAAADQQALKSDQAIKSVKRQLQSQQQRLQSLSTTDRNDWLLAEAEYLIRLANQRLLMGKEIVGALELLRAADAIARELDDAALFAVREALAKDIAALRQAAKLDIEGIYLTLGGLAIQADQLRLFAMPTFESATVEISDEPQTWRQRLDAGLAAAWQKLSSYIQIKRRDEIYKPLLAPEYEAAVRQNVRLMFEQSQMAALAGKQALYVDSLNKASQWLNNYYTLDNEKTALLIAQIEKLKAVPIVAQLPDISGSLRALKNYVELIHDIEKPQPAAEQLETSASTPAANVKQGDQQ